MSLKSENAMLERLYGMEIEAALSGHPLRGIFQTRSKKLLATLQALKEQGLVREVEESIADRFGTITVKGWELTLAGNAAYCLTCEGPQ